jgi:hypothetical protein
MCLLFFKKQAESRKTAEREGRTDQGSSNSYTDIAESKAD